jgi:hypothetical protein
MFFVASVIGCLVALLPMSADINAAQPPADAASLPADPQKSEKQHLILLIGAPGTDEYRDHFSKWAGRWKETAERAEIDCTIIGETEAKSGDASASQSSTESSNPPDAEQLKAAIHSAGQEESSEPLWLVYIGHGTFDGRTASWNLNGPDVSAEQLAELCKDVRRPLAVIACASCTAPFLNALSGPDRVIVTATKDGNQIQYSRFGDAMSQAISSLDADINRDGQTSLLEAWLFASRRTAEFYKAEGRLATEHSLLDDNGDALGIRAELYEGDRIAPKVESPEQVDGRLAARWHLLRSNEERQLTAEQRKARDAIELQIEDLRRQKSTLEEAEYLLQLEALLLPLAKIYADAEKSGADVSQ